MASSAATHSPTLLHSCCSISHRLILDPHKGHAYLTWLWEGQVFSPCPWLLFTVSMNSEQLPQSETMNSSPIFQSEWLHANFLGWLTALFVCFDLKKNPGKRFPAFSVTNSEPITDLFPLLPLVFRPLTNTYSTANTYSTRNLHSRATFRAAPGSTPNNWAVRDSTLLVSHTGHLHQLTSGREQLNTTQSRLNDWHSLQNSLFRMIHFLKYNPNIKL